MSLRSPDDVPALFENGAAEHVIGAGLPKLRSAMHPDTVFTFADRDLVTLYPTVMDAVRTFSCAERQGPRHRTHRRGHTPFTEVVAKALGLSALRIVETGGDLYGSERQQWDSGNNAAALEPAWSTTATPGPIPCCARPASRSSPSVR